MQANQKAHARYGPGFAYRVAVALQSLGNALENPQHGLRKCNILRTGLEIASFSLATWQLQRRYAFTTPWTGETLL